MAWLGMNFFYQNGFIIYRVWIHLFFQPPMPEKIRNTIWFKLESNPGPLVSQALITRPCLLGQIRQVRCLTTRGELFSETSNTLPVCQNLALFLVGNALSRTVSKI